MYEHFFHTKHPKLAEFTEKPKEEGEDSEEYKEWIYYLFNWSSRSFNAANPPIVKWHKISKICYQNQIITRLALDKLLS